MGRLDWREENMAGSSLEDTFKLFDMEGVNKIKRSDVGNVMRCMKLRPDEGQVAALVDEFASGPEVTLDQMRQIVDKYPSIATHELDAATIKQALYIFDKHGTRSIPRNEFESVMASEAFGHPFSTPKSQTSVLSWDSTTAQ